MMFNRFLKKTKHHSYIGEKLLFIHIPKSAGTSFRNGVEEVCSRERVWGDYPNTPNVFSKDCEYWMYAKSNRNEFEKVFFESDAVILSGHYDADKYIGMFSIGNVLTFVREPVSHVVSRFKARKRRGFKGTIAEFYRKKSNQNFQSQKLKGYPWQAFGFVGLTEEYEKSLSVIKKRYGLNVPYLKKNVAKRNELEGEIKLSNAQIEEIKNLNSKDTELYNEVVKYFSIRERCLSVGSPFTHFKVNMTDGELIGWAFYEKSDNPVVLELIQSSEKVAEVLCDQNVSIMDLNLPRDGNIGFRFKLNESIDISQLEIVVQDTRQPIYLSCS